MKFHDFSMTSAIFPKSMTFPGLENAFSNSMTFHDRMNPVYFKRLTLASSLVMRCTVKRPLTSYNRRKFSPVLSMVTTSATEFEFRFSQEKLLDSDVCLCYFSLITVCTCFICDLITNQTCAQLFPILFFDQTTNFHTNYAKCHC